MKKSTQRAIKLVFNYTQPKKLGSSLLYWFEWLAKTFHLE